MRDEESIRAKRAADLNAAKALDKLAEGVESGLLNAHPMNISDADWKWSDAENKRLRDLSHRLRMGTIL
ncbi:hypothetical protein UFOVP670_15 [uncultured Caudovirales phage]|uniref:Uncharacterized protein n=1 Tax=uncultured Caudovirales phage TaxID=2100421 RepID=A0A6J5NCW9_9CAUD|nr:hypothetical protein UFOVP670_15 [uncultured Caudovirales phage]